MEIYIDKPSLVMTSPVWKNFVKESSDLLEEMLLFAATSSKQREPKADSNEYDKMTVGMLRTKLEARNLDLEGTKQMLIQRLKDDDDHRAKSWEYLLDSDTDDGSVAGNKEKFIFSGGTMPLETVRKRLDLELHFEQKRC